LTAPCLTTQDGDDYSTTCSYDFTVTEQGVVTLTGDAISLGWKYDSVVYIVTNK